MKVIYEDESTEWMDVDIDSNDPHAYQVFLRLLGKQNCKFIQVHEFKNNSWRWKKTVKM